MISLSHDTSLYLDHPLADGFRLDKGKVSFKIPQVKPNNDYIVVRAYHIPHLSLLRRSLWLSGQLWATRVTPAQNSQSRNVIDAAFDYDNVILSRHFFF